MAQLTINIGTAPNDGTGDTLRDSFNKSNLNFTEIYGTGLVGSKITISDFTITSNVANQNIVIDPNGTGDLVIQSDNIIISLRRTISNSIGQTGDVEGMIAWDNDFVYVCTADFDNSTSIWKRIWMASF